MGQRDGECLRSADYLLCMQLLSIFLLLYANAEVTIKGTQLVLEVPKALVKGDVVATSYGWGVFAMVSTYTASEVAGGGGGIPVLPWNKTIAA
jgi:hypothetical protein